MEVKVVGGPCGYHGSYTFYKGIKIVSTQLLPSVNQQQQQQQQQNNNNNNSNNNNNNCADISNNNNNSGSKLTRKFSSDNLKYSNNINNNNNNSDIGDNNGGGINVSTTKSAKKPLIFALGDCIPVRPWTDSPIACLAELRMVWKDKNEQCLLTGLRLFFLPENTPLGRNCHGEDEVIAISDKVIIRADDLMTWIDNDAEWNWGLEAVYTGGAISNPVPNQSNRYLLRNSHLDFTDVDLEKQFVQNRRTNVAVLSYSRYCRYRATLKRLENINDVQIRNTLIDALSGFSPSCPNTRIMFCKDTFDYPELETHDLLCNHLAPKLKGRPRGRRKPTRSENSPGKPRSPSLSDSNESEESECSVRTRNRPEVNQRHNHRPARTKTKSECSEITFVAAGPSPKPRKPIKLTVRGTSTKNMTIVKSDEDDEENEEEVKERNDELDDKKLKTEETDVVVKTDVKDVHKIRSEAEQTAGLSPAKLEERNFLKKLYEFMNERLTPIPKLIWISLKDVNLYAIFTRVQELGGYDKLKTSKDWANLFVGSSTPEYNTITSKKYERVLLPLEQHERGVVEKSEVVEKQEKPIQIETEKLVQTIKEEEKSMEDHVESPKQDVPEITEDIEMDSEVEKILIKTEETEKTVPDTEAKEAELTVEQMKEIQMKVKSKENNVVTTTTTTTTTTTNHVLNVPPVTVIVGNDAGKSESNPSTSKIQIQQPHTTITVHQTTIHPQMSPKSNQNQPIQITNQIQIQQITVQPNNEVNQTNFNITQDKMGQEIQISPSTNGDYCKVLNRQSSSGDETNSLKKSSTLRHVRVKNKDNLNGLSPTRNTDNVTNKIDSHIPLILNQKMTTITPILGSNSIGSLDRDGNLGKRQKSPEIIELLDSDNENSNPKHVKMCPPVKKRKLEILREGGLEVTPIHHGAPLPVRKQDTPPSFEVTTKKLILSAPSVPKSTPRATESPKSQIAPVVPNINVPTPPTPQFQSHCMFKSSNKIFGNPKDVFQPQAINSKPINPASTYIKKENGIIDLTSMTPSDKKSSVEITKIPAVPPPSKKTSTPHSISLHLGGSNTKQSAASRDLPIGEKNLRTKTKIEPPQIPPQISLIPQQKLTHVQHIHNSQNHNIKRNLLAEPTEVKKKSNNIPPPSAPLPPPPQSPITIPKPSHSPSIPPPSFNSQTPISSSTPSNNPNIIPPPPASYFPSMSQLPSMATQAATNPSHYSPFLPLLDPLYLSTLYASRGMLFPPTPHVSPEFLQYYTKNMAAAQSSGLPITKS